jgi:hypothetical protein
MIVYGPEKIIRWVVCKRCGTEFNPIRSTARYCEGCEPSSNRKEDVKKYIKDYKLSHPCPCGEADPACLMFHHKDFKTKSFSVSAGGTGWMVLSRVVNEISKCDVMCLNCHAKYHAAHPEIIKDAIALGKLKASSVSAG